MDIPNPPIELLNLKQGQEVEYMGLRWKFLLPYEKVDDQIIFTSSACGGNVGDDYIMKARVSSEFQIIVYCSKHERYMEKCVEKEGDFSGVIGFCFAKKIYNNGIYISITCSESRSLKKRSTLQKELQKPFYTLSENSKMSVVKTKIGLLLRVIMLRYARSIGITSAYNHAANQPLVQYYKKLGWVISTENTPCYDHDPLVSEFLQIKGVIPVDYFKAHSASETCRGWAMKLCNYDVDQVTRYGVDEFIQNLPEVTRWYNLEGRTCIGKLSPFADERTSQNRLNDIEHVKYMIDNIRDDIDK